MSEKIEELTFDYRNEEGVLVRREVDRAVLSKGAWATIMFLYQDLDRAAGRYRAPKVAIVRYRKNNGQYRKQSSFNISSERQGRLIMEVLERWYGMTEENLPPAEVEAAESSSGPESVGEHSAGTDMETDAAASPMESAVSTPGQDAAAVEESPRSLDGSPSPFGTGNP